MRKIIISIFILIIFNVLVGCNTEKKYDISVKILNNINDDVIIFEPEDKKKEYTIEFCYKDIRFYIGGYMYNSHPTLGGVWLTSPEGDFKHTIGYNTMVLNEDGKWENHDGVYPYWWGDYWLSYSTDTRAEDWNYRSFSLIVHVI